MNIEHDVPLAPKTTLGIGGPARRLVRVMSSAELPDALALSDDILVLGGGSNLVIGDAGWPGVVLEIALRGVSIDCNSVSVAAGVVLDVHWSIQNVRPPPSPHTRRRITCASNAALSSPASRAPFASSAGLA